MFPNFKWSANCRIKWQWTFCALLMLHGFIRYFRCHLLESKEFSKLFLHLNSFKWMHFKKLYSLVMEVYFWISVEVLDFEISWDTFKLSKSKYSKTYGFLHYISSIKCMIFLIVVYMFTCPCIWFIWRTSKMNFM